LRTPSSPYRQGAALPASNSSSDPNKSVD
jgi:hypothetical protein